jgi:fumarate hydratase class I
LKTAKLLSARYYDSLPTSGDESGRAFRDIQLEESILNLTRKMDCGAQFGGKYLCHDIRIVRLPRHGASCFIGIEVVCSANRCIKAKINSNGIWVEKLEENPAQFIPEKWRNEGEGTGVKIDLNHQMKEVLADLSKYPLSTHLFLSGTLIVARDITHAKLKERLDSGQDLPQYFKDHPIYYAGPAKTLPGINSGSAGPTTAIRMDEYVEEFQQHDSSLIMIAK